ncbi:hypothetical protein [uncultured Pseudoteredinibacter sp.]|uniref:hypothetical protein n=1 Tax=uncultured Pseudoteredinibacter sp. TaxID=1641701 RepID=UPI0026352A93|nr:hypothetical protein [uncultured Pseudoteredinibacter sp.]
MVNDFYRFRAAGLIVVFGLCFFLQSCIEVKGVPNHYLLRYSVSPSANGSLRVAASMSEKTVLPNRVALQESDYFYVRAQEGLIKLTAEKNKLANFITGKTYLAKVSRQGSLTIGLYRSGEFLHEAIVKVLPSFDLALMPLEDKSYYLEARWQSIPDADTGQVQLACRMSENGAFEHLHDFSYSFSKNQLRKGVVRVDAKSITDFLAAQKLDPKDCRGRVQIWRKQYADIKERASWLDSARYQEYRYQDFDLKSS